MGMVMDGEEGGIDFNQNSTSPDLDCSSHALYDRPPYPSLRE